LLTFFYILKYFPIDENFLLGLPTLFEGLGFSNSLIEKSPGLHRNELNSNLFKRILLYNIWLIDWDFSIFSKRTPGFKEILLFRIKTIKASFFFRSQDSWSRWPISSHLFLPKLKYLLSILMMSLIFSNQKFPKKTEQYSNREKSEVRKYKNS